ncbi:MAG: hypothetical protein ACI9W6_000704 [Motiliproteus sp.]|jgi:hypothetical protein
MLRWLFLILLLVNAMLYGWFYQEREHRRSLADRVEKQPHAVAGLELLTEVPASALRESEPKLLAAVDAPPDRSLYCYRFGPFAEAQGLEAWLGDEGVGRLALEQEEVSVLPSGYGVTVSAPEGVVARQALLESMGAVGLQGQWLEGAGAKEVLSLGVYEEQASAEALGRALQQQNYDAVVQEQRRYSYHYYLLLRTNSEAVAGSKWLRSLLKKFPNVKTEKKLCQRVARTRGPE